MKFMSYSSPAEKATIEFEQSGPRTIITIRQKQSTIDGYPDDDRITIVSVPTADLLIVAQVFGK